MKKIICFIFLLTPFLSSSQIDPSFSSYDFPDTTKIDTLRFAGIFISGGVGLGQYFNNNLFNSSSVYSRQNPISGYSIRIGADLQQGKQKILHHLFEGRWFRYSGNVRSAIVNESSGIISETSWLKTIQDTVQTKFSLTSFSLGYKFQPTFDHFFFSIGVSAAISILMTRQNIFQQVTYSWNDVGFGTHGTNVSSNTRDTSFKTLMVNLPIQIGIGSRLHFDKIDLKPALYFSSMITKGLLFYNFSLDILFNSKLKK